MKWCGVYIVVAIALIGCGTAQPDDAGARADIVNHQSAEVTVEGHVTAVLSDLPNEGDGPHQRFMIDIGNGVIVEIDYNLDLASRVPVTVGSDVIVHGELDIDPGQPIIHYTHHSTSHHEAGWVQLNGQVYQ